ncbi:MAG: APC family permease [Verrucomicrobia bacterium]|nr:APC family permease [Verrucomicrobiota bacterium]
MNQSTESRLRPHCLNFVELLAQNIAVISPTMTAALIVPLMYSNTGAMSWLSYAVGTVMLLFVAFNLNQFAKRSSGTGSMYSYTSVGLGPSAGCMSGWCLIWAYLFIGIAGTTGFTIFAAKILAAMGINIEPVILFAVCLAGCFVLAYFDIKASTVVSLVLEAISVTLILILCLIVLGQHHFAIDTTQFSFSGFSWMNLGLGVVVAVFSLVGFESSTAFGEEAKDPTKTVPKSIIWSLIATGAFFVFVCYAEVLATNGYSTTLDKIDAPLSVMADLSKVSFLALPLCFGAMASFFALALSCMNAGARVMLAMGRHGIFHAATSKTHLKHETPHMALGVMAILMFVVVAASRIFFKFEVLDEFNDAGTMGAFGFIGAYVLVTLAAPFYLKKRGELNAVDVVWCVAALALLMIPAIGSVYPVPSAPVNFFPYIFLAYLLVGLVRIVALKVQAPERIKEIREKIHSQHAPDLLVPEA